MASLLEMIAGAFKSPANTNIYRKQFGEWELQRQQGLLKDNPPQMDFDSWMKVYNPTIPYVPGGGVPPKGRRTSLLGEDTTFLS